MATAQQPILCKIRRHSEPVLPFGKHKGKPLSQVEDDYLRWMQTKMPSEQWGKLASKVLHERNLQQKPKKKNSVQTLIAHLKACSTTRDLRRGRETHAQAVAHGQDSNLYVLSTLVRMYARCGSMAEARRVFESIDKPDVVSWNCLLLGYAENGEGSVVMELFSRMKASGCAPDFVTYISVLKACIFLAADGDGSDCLKRGREIHLEIGCNLNHHIHIQNTLINMYAKCGSIDEARCVFNSIQKPNVVSWNSLLMGYAENGEGLVVLDLFLSMKASGCSPDSVTYLAALKACASLAGVGDGGRKKNCLERGRAIHTEIGSNMNAHVQNTLIDMYAKCGSITEAHNVFDSMQKPDVVSWTALLLGYTENGQGLVALDLFSRMKASGCAPNSVTYVSALKACTSLAIYGDGHGKELCLERGREIHLEIGSKSDLYIQSTLMDMYAKCGNVVGARLVFDKIQKPNVVSWTALLQGYADNGEGVLALDLFSKMKASGCAPNSVTYVAALKACGLTGALALGQKLHSEITEFSSPVVTSLVDFYGKCGSMVEAHEVFDLYPKARNTATWNALLGGYGRFGDSGSATKLFEAMQDEGFRPDGVTFLCMLSCCSHAGLVEKAREYFEAMDARYRVTPDLMHYCCMYDVLGRANP